MKKKGLINLVLCTVLIAVVSCREKQTKVTEVEVLKEEIEKINAIEKDIETTEQKIKNKTQQAEEALSELDNL